MASPAAVVLVALISSCSSSAIAFSPHVVPYQELASGSAQVFQEALTQVGMVAVSNIPNFDRLSEDVLRYAHQCFKSVPEEVAREHIFEDGTSRKTLAFTQADTDMHTSALPPDCFEWQAHQGRFRQRVTDVAQVFARRLDDAFGLDSVALLRADDGIEYKGFSDIFRSGDHLEHVHEYYLPAQKQGQGFNTMEFHTDQGLCIAFTPALLIQDEVVRSLGKVPSRANAGKFEIELLDGAKVEVDFGDAELVFMLGDGVHQYVNQKMHHGVQLRAVPHALTMPSHAVNEWRLWYGRMFMAPTDSVSSDSKLTHGNIRDLMMNEWLVEDGDRMPRLSLGCSPGLHAQELRELSEDPPCSSGSRRRCSGNCADNQKQCWWRCMNFTQIADTCAAKGMAWNCTNRRDEISAEGRHHGDYDLRCTSESNTQQVRGNCDAAFDRLNVGKSTTCTAAGFESFLESVGAYTGRHNLAVDDEGHPQAVLKWKISNGKVSGMMAYNGKVSWLSVGLENRDEGSGKYGMMGANVILGVSSSDTEFPNHTGTVQEYKIHDSQSRFGQWNVPLSPPALESTTMIEENCYTAMRFTTDSIFGEPLNINSGTNRMIWAARTSTLMQVGKDSYHEGCDGEARTRNRGGGRNAPLVIDFQSAGQTVDLSSAISMRVSMLFFVMIVLQGLQF